MDDFLQLCWTPKSWLDWNTWKNMPDSHVIKKAPTFPPIPWRKKEVGRCYCRRKGINLKLIPSLFFSVSSLLHHDISSWIFYLISDRYHWGWTSWSYLLSGHAYSDSRQCCLAVSLISYFESIFLYLICFTALWAYTFKWGNKNLLFLHIPLLLIII